MAKPSQRQRRHLGFRVSRPSNSCLSNVGTSMTRLLVIRDPGILKSLNPETWIPCILLYLYTTPVRVGPPIVEKLKNCAHSHNATAILSLAVRGSESPEVPTAHRTSAPNPGKNEIPTFGSLKPYSPKP